MPSRLTPVGQLTGQLTPVIRLKGSVSGRQEIRPSLNFGERIVLANTIFTYLGILATLDSLPANPANGDVYWVESEESNYAWMGERWINIGANTMAEKLTPEQIAALQGLLND